MKKSTIFKLLFSAIVLFASAAFTSCVDDNADNGVPFLEVTPDVMSYDLNGAPIKASELEILTNRAWSIVVDEADASWVRPSLTSGDGNAKVTFNIFASQVARRTTIRIVLRNKYDVYAEKKITITQGDQVPAVVIYNETFGESGADKSPYLFLDQYTDYVKTGEGAADVTYANSAAVSARQSGKLSAGYDNASGHTKAFFGANSSLIINKIALKSDQTNLTLNFGGSYSKNNNGTYDNKFYSEKFHVYVSADGTTWSSALEYTFRQADEFWVYASVNFSLKNPVSTLYVKFMADEGSVFAIDDPTLVTSNGGQQVDLSAGAVNVTTNTPTNVTETGATFSGAVSTTDGVTAVGFQYIANASSIDWNGATKVAADAVAATFTKAVTGLTTGTTYAVRAYATTADGDVYGTVTTFTPSAAPSTDAYFHTNIGTKAVDKPYPLVGDYADWQAKGSGAANVTYSAEGMISVRASGKANTGAYTGASGPNVVFFGTFAEGGTSNAFMINNITVPSSQTKMQLTFGASRSSSSGSYPNVVYDNEFKTDKFIVSLSADGTAWTPITYTVNEGDKADPFWVFATADFTLKSGVSKIYIKFSASEASVFRLDDINLASSATGGQQIDLGGTTPAGPAITVNPESLSFTADGDAVTGKTIAVTVENQQTYTLYASSSDNTQFPTTISGNTVTVKALANNDAQAKSATITVYLATAEGLAHVAEKTVAVSQAAKTVSVDAITIPEVLALAKGDFVSTTTDKTLTAVVCGDPTGDNFSFGTLYLMTEGSTAAGNGIVLYNTKQDADKNNVFNTGNYALGDKLEITLKANVAKIDEYNSIKQVTAVTDADIVKKGKVTVTPVTVTVAQLASYVSMPVTVLNATIAVPNFWCTAAAHGSHTFNVAGTEFPVYVNKRATVFQDKVFAAVLGSISGIANIASGKGQVAPRNLDDVKAFNPTTPIIVTTSPRTLSWDAAVLTGEPIEVGGADLDGKLTATSSAGASSVFTVAISGTTVTVTPKAANTSAADITETLTIAATGGNNITVALTQLKPASGEAPLLSEDFASIAGGNNTATSGSSTAWTGNANFPTVTKAYQAGGAVKIGASSDVGSITSKALDLSAPFTVKLKVKGWSSVETKVTVTVGSESKEAAYTATIGGAFEDVTLSFGAATATSTVKIATSGKRAFIDEVVITK